MTVTVSGPNLIGGEKNYITDKNGYYRFPSLPAGSYTVFAELKGFTKVVREVIRLNANMSLTIDLVLKQTTVNEVITVTASSPMIDVKSSSQGATVMTNDFLMDLPVPKDITGILLMAAGTDSELQSAYGASRWENNIVLDGIYITGISRGGDTSFRPDFNIIQEAEFTGKGLSAEYGEFTGGFINVVTKSGSNKLSGMAEITMNGPFLSLRAFDSSGVRTYSSRPKPKGSSLRDRNSALSSS